ncbi:MAG: hypothetical protein QM786_17200 [Breznakibacter sp.]
MKQNLFVTAAPSVNYQVVGSSETLMAKKAFHATLVALGLWIVMALFAFSANATNADGISLSGDSNTPMGGYSISELQSETINGQQARKFELKYENAKSSVFIYVVEKAKCKDYIVRSSDMEVKYACRKAGFGAERLFGKEAQFKPENNEIFMNLAAFDQQRKIAEGDIPEEKALGLIACYFPSLLKYQDLL